MTSAGLAGEASRLPCSAGSDGPQRRLEIVDKPDQLPLSRQSCLGEDILQMGLHGIFGNGQRESGLGNRSALQKAMQGSRFSGSQPEAFGDAR